MLDIFLDDITYHGFHSVILLILLTLMQRYWEATPSNCPSLDIITEVEVSGTRSGTTLTILQSCFQTNPCLGLKILMFSTLVTGANMGIQGRQARKKE